MAEFETLLYTTAGPVATITLNRPVRNTPEALEFIATAATEGVRAAVERRDGPFGDYSQAPTDLRPDPSHVITP